MAGEREYSQKAGVCGVSCVPDYLQDVQLGDIRKTWSMCGHFMTSGSTGKAHIAVSGRFWLGYQRLRMMRLFVYFQVIEG